MHYRLILICNLFVCFCVIFWYCFCFSLVLLLLVLLSFVPTYLSISNTILNKPIGIYESRQQANSMQYDIVTFGTVLCQLVNGNVLPLYLLTDSRLFFPYFFLSFTLTRHTSIVYFDKCKKWMRVDFTVECGVWSISITIQLYFVVKLMFSFTYLLRSMQIEQIMLCAHCTLHNDECRFQLFSDGIFSMSLFTFWMPSFSASMHLVFTSFTYTNVMHTRAICIE